VIVIRILSQVENDIDVIIFSFKTSNLRIFTGSVCTENMFDLGFVIDRYLWQ